ncbi:hypothetical protein HDV00_009707 [Rhizophlyctis rosea]|nr:hypothetical protein HDV00_009707 [Rhizophlyctis rosea]
MSAPATHRQNLKELLAEEFRSGQSTPPSAFYRDTKCYLCHKPLTHTQATKSLCSQCRGVTYCSRECQVADWKAGGPRIENGRPQYFTPHKVVCPKIKGWMEKERENVALRGYFPWLGVAATGQSFPMAYCLAKNGVDVFDMGAGSGIRRGFWNITAHAASHALSYEQMIGKRREELSAAGISKTEAEKTILNEVGAYEPGAMLLTPSFPTDEDGWKLPELHFPRILSSHDPAHSSTIPPPLNGKILTSWQEYYEWRSLPPTSIAALLLHMPLTVYNMITKFPHILNDPSQPLTIHLLGPERELDILPLFAELLFLLPHTTISITMIGPTGYALGRKLAAIKSKEDKRAALLSKDPVFTYTHPTNPERTLTIHIDTTHETYQSHPSFTSPQNTPTILLALNAGLSTYPTWPPILKHTLVYNIPFACTEYCEQSVEYYYGRVIVPLLNEVNREIVEGKVGGRQTGLGDVKTEFNGFRQPGGKGNEFTRAPDHVDGFLTWVWRE